MLNAISEVTTVEIYPQFLQVPAFYPLTLQIFQTSSIYSTPHHLSLYYDLFFLLGYFGDFHPSDVFLRKMKGMQRSSRSFSVSEKELIEEALEAREKVQEERGSVESRYMLLLTKNSAALRILQMRPGSHDQEIIFGSSFPKDQEYSQICANINRIKICMETGKQVVLCNLDALYESLYDVLNQHYSFMGGNKYVDLGLGTHR